MNKTVSRVMADAMSAWTSAMILRTSIMRGNGGKGGTMESVK